MTTTYRDVMLDLETLGRAPGCAVLSVGAVAFDAESGTLGPPFYAVVHRASCRLLGLAEDAQTLAWWSVQSDEALLVLKDSESLLHSRPLSLVLEAFGEWLASLGPAEELRLWGNGAGFDQPILAACYRAAGREPPWRFYNERCYRTLKSLPGLEHVQLRRAGTAHHAYHDAVSQATHAIGLLRRLAMLETLAMTPSRSDSGLKGARDGSDQA